MDSASETILALKPVTFRYKQELDPDAIPQFGLIAEEVEKVNPDLVVRDADGKVNTVRYEAVNAMLLNEFLKEHRNVAEQQSTIAELKATVAKQQEAFGSKIAQQQKQIETGGGTAKGERRRRTEQGRIDSSRRYPLKLSRTKLTLARVRARKGSRSLARKSLSLPSDTAHMIRG